MLRSKISNGPEKYSFAVSFMHFRLRREQAVTGFRVVSKILCSLEVVMLISKVHSPKCTHTKQWMGLAYHKDKAFTEKSYAWGCLPSKTCPVRNL